MPVQSNPDREKSDKLSAWLIFIALNLIALPFSAYQTFRGYEMDLGVVIAGAIAALTTVFFIAINYEIANRRRSGRNVFGLFVLYILPLAFSFPGNFGAFYTQFTGDLRDTQWASKISKVELNVQSAKAAVLNCDVDWSNRSKLFSAERAKLIAQFNDPAYQGWGPECEKIYKVMARAVSGSSQFAFTTKTKDLDPRLAEADRAFESKQQEVLDDRVCFSGSFQQCQLKLDEHKEADRENWSAAERGSYLNELKIANDKLVECVAENSCSSNLTKIDVLQDTDGLQWAFKSAYIDRESGVNAALCTLLALVIDLGVLLFILILFKPEVRGRLTGRG